MYYYLCEFIYILALSLQLAGALILVKINFYKTSKESIRRELIGTMYVFDGGEVTQDGVKILLGKEEMRKCAYRANVNAYAFVYLLVGYLLSIFGSIKTGNRFCICFCIVVFSFLLVWGGHKLAGRVAKKCYSEDREYIIKEKDK